MKAVLTILAIALAVPVLAVWSMISDASVMEGHL